METYIAGRISVVVQSAMLHRLVTLKADNVAGGLIRGDTADPTHTILYSYFNAIVFSFVNCDFII